MRLTHFSDYALRVLMYAAARGKPYNVFEDASNERVTVLEWDRPEGAIQMYQSELYQSALALLDGKVVRDNRIIEGV